MRRLTSGCLCALIGLAGCVQMPTSHSTFFGTASKSDAKDARPTSLAPLAPPPPITARFVNQSNAHEITESLWSEIERDLHNPVGPLKSD